MGGRIDKRADGPTDGRTVGRTVRWTGSRTGERTNLRRDGRTDGRTNERTSASVRTDRQSSVRTDRQTNKHTKKASRRRTHRHNINTRFTFIAPTKAIVCRLLAPRVLSLNSARYFGNNGVQFARFYCILCGQFGNQHRRSCALLHFCGFRIDVQLCTSPHSCDCFGSC